jgi:hypothetical protein
MSGRRARIGRCDRTGRLKYELRPEATEETLNIKVTATVCNHYMTFPKYYASYSNMMASCYRSNHI